MIDWAWVRKDVVIKERIGRVKPEGQKRLILSCLDESLSEAISLARPRKALVNMKVVKISPDGIALGGACLNGKRITSYLKNASHVSIFCVTVGPGIEAAASRRMNEGDSLRGYFLDRIGSSAVESLARNTEEEVRKKYASKSLSSSMRVSPGYCDLPIESQRILSRIVPFSKAGVRLNRSCMMIPRKSISAVMGIGPNGIFGKTKSQCRMCDKNDCSYRRR